MVGRQLFDTENFPFEKSPVRLEPRHFTVPGVFVTSITSAPETQRNLNLLLTEPRVTISKFDH